MLTKDSATFESVLMRLNPMLGERAIMDIMAGVIVAMKAASEQPGPPGALEERLRSIALQLVAAGQIEEAPTPTVVVRHGNVIVRWA